LVQEALNLINSFVRTCFYQQMNSLQANSNERMIKKEESILKNAFSFL